MQKESLHLTEVFTSIQGETSYTGYPTTFIRLARCNLRCTWCDTPYSFPRGESWTLAAIVERCQDAGARHICVTGGEPLLQASVHPLMRQLCDLGYRVSIETGGSLPIEAIDPRVKVILDLKCPGSGMVEKNLWANIEQLKAVDEVKFVLLDRADFDWAVHVIEQYKLRSKVAELLFSPVFDVLEPSVLVEWILEEQLPVRLNLQMHKFIWEPSTQGV
jgi:7-carboxy-7-deazaguanine synthase